MDLVCSKKFSRSEFLMTLANAKGELRPLPLKCAAEAIFNHSNCSDFWAQYSEAKHAHVCAKDTEQPLLNNVKKKKVQTMFCH